MQGQTRRVLREDAGNQLPEAKLLIDAKEPLKRRTTDPRVPIGLIDIHGVLGDAVIAPTTTIGTSNRPADNGPVFLDDDGGKRACFLDESLTDLLDRAGFGLKCRDAFTDALVVNARDSVSVVRTSRMLGSRSYRSNTLQSRTSRAATVPVDPLQACRAAGEARHLLPRLAAPAC
jgi:hypothetical protein